jgi:putative transposase
MNGHSILSSAVKRHLLASYRS